MQALLLYITMLCFSMDAVAKQTLVFSTVQDSAIQDISVKVLSEAYRKLGYHLEIMYLPNVRALETSNAGFVDGEVSRIKGINIRFINLIPVSVAINYLEGFAFSKRTDLNINNWESLRPYDLISVRVVKFVEQNLTKRSLDYADVTFFTSAVNMLQFDRSDIAILPKLSGLQAIREAKASEVIPVGKALIKAQLYHYLHVKHEKLLPKVNSVLLEMHNSGRIQEIRAEYIKKHGYLP